MGPSSQSRAYAFTDPLAASDATAARRRTRHALGLIYGTAVPSVMLALLTDGGPPSQRIATGVAMVVAAVVAALALAWRRAPGALLVAAFPLATLVVTAIAVLDPPLALTPMFYVGPLMTSAYFLQRREAVVTYAVACLSFGAASLWALEDGPRLMQWITVAMVGGVVSGFVGALKDGLERHVAELRTLAREDPLTGALNRRALTELLDAEIARARRTRATCAVAVVDVDHFKAINDRFGHATGDAALVGLVSSVSARLRGGDAVGRLGGEEFAVVLSGPDAEGAGAFAEDVRARVAHDAATRGIPFTISVGVAALADGAPTADALLAAADGALYRAKRAGRDTVRSA